jgi:predicted nucleic acid-binding protein
MIYWDTSVILKLYVDEPDSMDWQRMAVSSEPPLRSSSLALSELAHALKQLERAKRIRKNAASALHNQFRTDVEAGRFVLLPLGQDVIDLSVDFALKAGGLRTLDGLHLASARLLRCSRMATGDNRLAQVAETAGFQLVSVDRP